MNGYAICTSVCIACGRLFSYNPRRVPSTSLFTGSKEPVCQECIDCINTKREAQGLEPFRVHPHAYEPCREEEL